MPKFNERGAVQFIVLLIILIGIAGGVFLVNRGEPLKLFPQAKEDKVSGPIPNLPKPKPTKKPRPPRSTPSPSPSPASLTVSPTVLYSNGTLKVTWSNIPNPHLKDYININTSDDQHGVTSHTYWINNNCSWFAPDTGTPKASGSCTISLENDSIDTTFSGPYHLVLASGATPSVTTVIAKSNDFNLIKRVFITSTKYNGNLGGLSGADTKCQVRVSAGSLGGSWKAWLSDSTTSAASRLTHNSGPYKLLDGTTIADNWTDLTDGTLQAVINISEFATTVTSNNVWTNTTTEGLVNNDPSIGPAHCQDWTSSAMDVRGGIGSMTTTGSGWTESGFGYCVQLTHLFCFEQ